MPDGIQDFFRVLNVKTVIYYQDDKGTDHR
jgi:hypothetical protein